MASASCLPTPTASTSQQYTLSAASQLPAASTAASTSFVRRNGSQLALDGAEFNVVGPNVYWLGLDENVDPSPSYPSKGRVLEAMAVASAMGATTIRSTSLGVSFGTGLSIENALGQFKPEGDPAWDAIDFALLAARSYGLRLVIPLTDQYDYYHGGIPTFLRWRNLSSTDFSPFYDLNSPTCGDFALYVRTLLNHTSPYTNLTMATDPTVLAFETGNELGGWTGDDYPPPAEWTTAVAQLLHELAPDTLVLSGSYGVRKDELEIAGVDMVSDHFYPPSLYRLSSSASLAASAQKPFLIGEYDWTNRYYVGWRWAWFLLVLPAVLSALLYLTPRRWWPLRTTLRGVVTCGCCCARRRQRRKRARAAVEDEAGRDEAVRLSMASRGPSTPPPSYDHPLDHDALSTDKSLFASTSSADLPILPASTSSPSTTFPPSRRPPTRSSSSLLDRPFPIYRWHVALALFVILVPLLAPLLHLFVPTQISAFLSRSAALAARDPPHAVGDLYWSLFGRDDACCAYVPHGDGYTLHYPSAPGPSGGAAGMGSGDAVAQLARHAWEVRGERPYWLEEGRSIGDVRGWRDLPVVACPQEGLRLANGTVVGGSTSS
ncbi:glycoside hydrolase family 5 protein [Rhodotorula graminis WP1]|uniref:mannan endo-1,4-beta-mannosidase n=1 Tax=Rhodotorula graminis (strain WP1) TaxID=578459 RepID=A0A194S9A5_RHOGW|nr:glycoside hydrolase family 5 protein [Rhodotorula graminis WP1]KPV77313.1 glycoside hydrolase family 5 protein [Rhodotorula graminis WP1]